MAKPPKKTGSGAGYGRPPRGTRFKPGKSGNPKGRPKGAKKRASIEEELLKELNKPVFVNINGRKVRKSVREVIVKQWINGAMKGNTRALSMLLGATNNLRTVDLHDAPPKTIKWTFDFKSQVKLNPDATFDDDEDPKGEDDEDK